MTGIMTFSSKLLSCAAAHVTVASLPMTRAQTCITALAHHGVHLARHDASCRAASRGARISPMPQRGPLPSQRMSLAILVRRDGDGLELAAGLRRGRPSRSAPRSDCALRGRRCRCLLPRCRTTMPGKSGWQFSPVPTAVPPRGSSSTARRSQRCRRADARSSHLPRVAAEFLTEPHRRRVHEMRAADLDDVPEFHRLSHRARRAAARARARAYLRRRSPTATWIAVGMTSLRRLAHVHVVVRMDGVACEPMGLPASCEQRFAMTSLAFMFVEVPLPVWKMSIGKCSSSLPVDDFVARRAR